QVRFVVEDFFQVARTRQLREALEVEHRRSGCGDEWRVRGRGDAGHLLQESYILRMTAELVVSNQGSERCASKGAVLFLVNLLEHLALIELNGLIQILEQIRLADVQQLDLEAAGSFRLLDEIMQAPP